MPSGTNLRVLLVDDHEIVRTGVRRALDGHSDIEVVGEAGSCEETLEHPALTTADVLVLDMNLPDGDVIRLIPQVRGKAKKLRILMFTMQPEDAFAASALKAGAVGFLGKDRPSDELVAAIRKVGRGGTYVSEALAARLVESRGAPDGLPHEALSERERQIFDMVIQGETPGDISRELDLGTSTVATYLKRIREKIGVETNVELVQYAFRSKLVS